MSGGNNINKASYICKQCSANCQSQRNLSIHQEKQCRMRNAEAVSSSSPQLNKTVKEGKHDNNNNRIANNNTPNKLSSFTGNICNYCLVDCKNQANLLIHQHSQCKMRNSLESKSSASAASSTTGPLNNDRSSA